MQETKKSRKKFGYFKKKQYFCGRFRPAKRADYTLYIIYIIEMARYLLRHFAANRINQYSFMSKNLVIVESPAKAKTIEKFLGADYRVLSSQGHIRDIEGQGRNSLGIDFEHGYEPNYVVDPSKHRLIETLRSESKKADMVWLASDEDREGEAIAWHLKEVLNLDPAHTKRVVFHEITKNAILHAIENPRDIDYNLVNAQQARRVLDRIVGFHLPPILWRKIATGLSAGRVQSVAVRLVVEREEEIETFVSAPQYRITADFMGVDALGEEAVLHTELNHRFTTKDEAIAFLEQIKDASFRLESIQKKPGRKSPAPPFTTSYLQQEAARKLRFPVAKTMRVAQALYESGKITYMRTDSVNLSSLAINTAKQEVIKEYGERYHQARQYKTASKSAQEAHEAIRPTYMEHPTISGTPDEKNLYQLIWKRTLASQMADAEVETTRMEVSISGCPYTFIASGEVVLFDGFMRVYEQTNEASEKEEAEVSILPQMLEKQELKMNETVALQVFTKAPQRYNEATLVKKMEDLGIGRPSTYATIIETIQQRKYVENGNVSGTKRQYDYIVMRNGRITEKKKQEIVGADSRKLLPTDLGRATNAFLVEQFPEILSYDFTSNSEKQFDEIAEGNADWHETVDTFYHTFQPLIKDVPAGRIAARELGIDPATGLTVIAKISKNGPCIQLGSAEDDEKPRFVGVPKNLSIYTITLTEALKLFEHALPYTLGTYNGQEVVVGSAKYGPFIRIGQEFISIPKTLDPLTITMDDAKMLIERRKQMALPIHVFGDIQVLNGRFGPYIKCGDKNYKIPQSVNAETLTEAACRDIINQPASHPKKSPAKSK